MDPKTGKTTTSVREIGKNAIDYHFDLDKALKAFRDKEGCSFKGHAIIPNLPGTFSISSKPYQHYIQQFMN